VVGSEKELSFPPRHDDLSYVEISLSFAHLFRGSFAFGRFLCQVGNSFQISSSIFHQGMAIGAQTENVESLEAPWSHGTAFLDYVIDLKIRIFVWSKVQFRIADLTVSPVLFQ
jgi:hypothetical protein